MATSFPETGDSGAVVGQTPWSARVPLDPLFCNEISLIDPSEPTRASIAVQGDRPTN
jgi:hypothetical protein